MLFLEDHRAFDPVKTVTEPKAPHRLPPPPPEEIRYIGEPHLVLPERHEYTSAKRASIFSRRRSTAVNSVSEPFKRTSFVTGRRSSLAEMAGTESESFKNRFLFGFSQSKKHGLKSPELNKRRDGSCKFHLFVIIFELLMLKPNYRRS